MALSAILYDHSTTNHDDDQKDEESARRFPRNWQADEPRRHWELMVHCGTIAFPRPAPDLSLTTRAARFYWHLYTAGGRHELVYQKSVNRALFATLNKTVVRMPKIEEIIVSAQLVRLDSLDAIGREKLITRLEEIIRVQTTLESICLEGLSLTRMEALRLILALRNSRKTLKCFYGWRAFKENENPLPMKTKHSTSSWLYADKIPRKYDWFRAIAHLEFLTTLSVNYTYMATPTGDLLIDLSKNLGSKWHWLQLLCLPDKIPNEVNSNGDIVCHAIPDVAWKEASLWAPSLKVQYAFVRIPEYDKHKRFFTCNTPVHTISLWSDVQLKFTRPWLLNSTIKTLCAWYPKTLVYLYLQLWHQRDNLDSQLRTLFLLVPSLRVFEFIGEIRALRTLCSMCCQIKARKCNVKHVDLLLQEIIHEEVNKDKWIKSVELLLIHFRPHFVQMGVVFNVNFD